MDSLFLKLVNMSISASWLVLAIVALRFLMKKAPKWMTCALWALVAIRLVFSFSIESMFSLIPEPISSGKIVENITDDYWGATHIYHDNTDEFQIAVDAGREPIHAGEGHYYVVTGEDGVSEPPTFENTVVPVLSAVWITGMAIMALYATVSYLLIRRKVSASICLRDNIYLCDYIESPFILGIIRPKIYLPSALDQTQWPHVMAHENAHLHRRDHWWKPLGFAILCVYWFNPVLWLAYILLCRDIELACDERVIRDLDTNAKKAYSAALLECSMPRYLIAACPLAFGEVGVKERVKTVLNYKKPAFWIILIALLLCIAAAVCFLTDPVEKSTTTPGVYNNNDTDFLQMFPNSQGDQSMAGQYILQNDTLYAKNGQTITALGRMTPYELSEEELKEYFQADQWNRLYSHIFSTVSDALWLRMEDECFYVWFQTNSGETYLARGWEDLSERFTDSDDTYIAQLCRLTRDENAEEMELAWFDAIILEADTTWLLVSPITGSWEAEQYGQIEVSRYWYASENGVSGFGILGGEFSDGDRVRIVYNNRVQETYPSRISSVHSITKLPAMTTVLYNSIEEAILDGCVAMVDGDVVAGQTAWQDFITKTRSGKSATIRYVTYYTVGNPAKIDPELFAEIKDDYPHMYIHDLIFDGNDYTVRLCENGEEIIRTYQYLMHYTGVPETEYAAFESYERYVLTNRNDVTWADIMHGLVSSDFTDQIAHHSVYTDLRYADEPNMAELEIAKKSLEPYMLEYKITCLDANELTGRLDVKVSEWVDGLYELIEQFMDLDFVTITQQKGNLEFTEQPPKGTTPQGQGYEIALEVTNATATEGLVEWHLTIPAGSEIWTGYDYSLEVLTDDGWVHYGYPPEELAWESALLFHYENSGTEPMSATEAYDIQWRRTAESPLPSGTYRYCKGITIKSGDEISNQTYYAEFTIPEDNPENWGLHLEILNPTSTGATLALTYHGGLMGELSTGGKYYLMVDVGGGATKYGLVPSQVAWDDIRYSLLEGEPLYLNVRWDHTADAPLPEGSYYVVLEVDQSIPNGYGSGFHYTKYVTGEFQITSATAGTEPPGTYYRLTTVECLYMNPLSSQLPQDANGKYYIFDNGLFQIVQHFTKQVLFQCSTEDVQWQEFPFTEERWAEIMPFGGSEMRDRLWGAQYLRLSDNYCLFLKDDSLYVAYGHFNSEIPIEYFWDIYKLGIN